MKTRQTLRLMFLCIATLGASAGLAWTLHNRLGGSRATGSESVAVEVEPSRLEAGPLLYQVHCARCHGPEGHGDGPDGALLQRPPRDFSEAKGLDPARLRKAILEGVPGTPMAAFGPSLSTREVEALVDHLQTLGARRADEFASLLERHGFEPERTTRLAPPLSLRDLDGKPRSLDDLRGRVVLVAFWGTSCAPCVEELPGLGRLAERYHADGLSVLAVCVDGSDRDAIERAAGERTGPLTFRNDPDGSAWLGYDVRTLPMTVLIDRTGRLLGASPGAREWDGPEVRPLIEACLKLSRSQAE